jgi:FkbM family methyltransferase
VHRVLAAMARRGGPVEKEILGLGEVVGPGDVCLDVGAEFGLYTHVLADLVGPTGAVHAFEPQAGAHRWLSLGVRASGPSWVHLHRLALGSGTGAATLSVPRRRGLPVHGRAFVTAGARDEGPNAEFADRRHESVALTTLDVVVADLGLDDVALVKVDVEGAEGAVLDGAETVLARHRPHLLLEIEDRHTAKYGLAGAAVLERLAAQGYTPHVWTDGWRAVDGLVPEERNYLFRP